MSIKDIIYSYAISSGTTKANVLCDNSSNPTTTLAGLPAHWFRYDYTNPDDSSIHSVFGHVTKIEDVAIIAMYSADSHSFSKFPPTAEKIINSLNIRGYITFEETMELIPLQCPNLTPKL